MSMRRLSRLTGMLGLLLAIAGVAACGSSTPSTSARAPTPTLSHPTVAVTATGTSTIPNFPLAGWRAGGPVFATAIAFAPGSAQTAYACGAHGSPIASGTRPIAVALSTDGARTWMIEATPAQGVLCSLSVDPTNASDVVLFTTTCAQNCASDPVTHLYRSRNQGKVWAELALPALPADGAGAPAFTNLLAWSGATLVTETIAHVPNGHPVQHLLASANADPFARVDQAPIFAKAAIGKVFALGASIYVELFPAGCAGSYFCALAKTTDGGASWRLVTLRYRQQAVDLLAAGGTSLIVGTPGGAIQHAQIARTTNDGTTWQALPANPAGLAYYPVADGTVFLTDLDSGALRRLAPGKQQWQPVVPAPVALPTSLDDGSLTFQVDSNGHPVAVWRDAGEDQVNNTQYPGLQYFPL